MSDEENLEEQLNTVPERFHTAYRKLADLAREWVELPQNPAGSQSISKSDYKSIVDAHHEIQAVRQALCMPIRNVDPEDIIARAGRNASRTLKRMIALPPPDGYHPAIPPKLAECVAVVDDVIAACEMAAGRGRG